MNFNDNEFANDHKYRQFPIGFIDDPNVEPPLADAENHELFLLDISCSTVQTFLMNNQNRMAIHYTWLLFDSSGREVCVMW